MRRTEPIVLLVVGLVSGAIRRLGHFAQGFVPAIIAREILLRRTPPTLTGTPSA